MKILITAILFYLLILLQTTFLVHFNICGIVPNLVFISIIIWNIFEYPKKNLGLFSAGIGGFYLDVFSNRPMGFYILILIGLAVIIKFILKKYVQIPFLERT